MADTVRRTDRSDGWLWRIRDIGAGMSDEMAAVGAGVLPEVDDILADALRAQGEAGVRALGL